MYHAIQHTSIKDTHTQNKDLSTHYIANHQAVIYTSCQIFTYYCEKLKDLHNEFRPDFNNKHMCKHSLCNTNSLAHLLNKAKLTDCKSPHWPMAHLHNLLGMSKMNSNSQLPTYICSTKQSHNQTQTYKMAKTHKWCSEGSKEVW